MKTANFPTAIVNMSATSTNTPKLNSIDYYKSFGLSLSSSEILSRHNKNGKPIEEFYWLDQKWWDFYTEKNKKVIDEIRELVGGAFIKLSLRDQCSLLNIPFYAALNAPRDTSSASKKKWISNTTSVTPEEYLLNLIRKEFDIIIADEGEHLKAWIPMFYNLYYKHRESIGLDMFADDFGSTTYKRLARTETINLAKTYSDEAFYSLTRNQIERQIEESWWSSRHGVEETIAAAKCWGKDKILTLADLNMWGAGIPDIMAYKNGHHTFIEVKTTDRLHQSQAHFIRNSKIPMCIDIRVVQMIASTGCTEESEADFLSWIRLKDH